MVEGYFDFSNDVRRAIAEAQAARDRIAELSAKTAVHNANFPASVKEAGFQFLRPGGSFVPCEKDIVIGAAPWSDPDLAALEGLVSYVRSGAARISVFSVDEWSLPELVCYYPVSPNCEQRLRSLSTKLAS